MDNDLVRNLNDTAGLLIKAAIIDNEIADNEHWDELYGICGEIAQQTRSVHTLSKTLCSALFGDYTGLVDVVSPGESCQMRIHEFNLLIGEILNP